VTAIIGFLFERTLYVHVHRKSHLDQVLFTIGLFYVRSGSRLCHGLESGFVQVPNSLQGKFDVFELASAVIGC
jgi:branched-chain amino acid transport system permease protein